MIRDSWRSLAACLLPLALGCARVDVQTEIRPGTDFSRFATFAQEPPPPTTPEFPGVTPAIASRVQAEIAESLDAKVYRAAPASEADLKVAFRITTSTGVRWVNAGQPETDYDVPRNVVHEVLEIVVVDARSGE